MLRTNLRDTKRNTPGPLGPGVFGVVRLLVSVTVMVAVVFFLAGLSTTAVSVVSDYSLAIGYSSSRRAGWP